MKDYSIHEPSPKLIDDIKTAMTSVSDYGSVEIFIQGGVVTQINVRHIKKTLKHLGKY